MSLISIEEIYKFYNPEHEYKDSWKHGTFYNIYLAISKSDYEIENILSIRENNLEIKHYEEECKIAEKIHQLAKTRTYNNKFIGLLKDENK